VQEFRITLGDFERKTLTKQLNEDDTLKKAQTISTIGKSVAISGAVVGGTVAVSIIGSLAVKAYREGKDLVSNVDDIGATAWDVFKMSIGLMPVGQGIANATKRKEKEALREAEGRPEENLGFLEWGFDAIMTFLLGEDKTWTQTTVVNEDDAADIAEQLRIQREAEAQTYEDSIDDPISERVGDNETTTTRRQQDARAQGRGWSDYATMVTTLLNDRTYQNLILAQQQFCDSTSPDFDTRSNFDPQLCREITADIAAREIELMLQSNK